MKIVFFGTPEFAVPALEALSLIPGMEVTKVITQPDKPVGRKLVLTPPPVKVAAQKLKIECLQPRTKKELAKQLENTKADFFIVIAYGMILTEEILSIPKFGAINVHASLLPRYRGASPIQESFLHGDADTGVSIMKMDKELDHGPVYLLKRIAIEKSDTLETLTQKLSLLGSTMLPPLLNDIAEGQLRPIPQKHENATFCTKITKNDGKIDWNTHSAEQIYNMTRAYTPWPSVQISTGEKTLKIIETSFTEEQLSEKPGTFVLDGKSLKIATIKGTLIPKKLQPEGKKEMDIASFLNGYKQNLKP